MSVTPELFGDGELEDVHVVVASGAEVDVTGGCVVLEDEQNSSVSDFVCEG